MAGHSKWANIKHRKGAQDKKRSSLFSRLTREIIVCARQDSDPDTNVTLAAAIERARAANMPKDNIERAVKKGAGNLDGVQYAEVTYEGYGPGGAAILLRALTDNRNRTASMVRNVFEGYGGSLGGEGSVAWQFDRRGVVEAGEIGPDADREALILVAAEAGADDFADEDGIMTFHTPPTGVAAVRDALRAEGVTVTRAEISLVPKATVRVEGKDAERLLKLMDALDEQEDVQEVVANFDIPDEVLTEIEGG